MIGRRSRCIVLVVAACALACSKKDAAEDPATTASAAPLIEAFSTGSVAWVVDKAGHIRADVKDANGVPIAKDATGTVEWKTDSGETHSAPLAYDADAKALVAVGPPPTQDITPLHYQIVAKGEHLAGTLHVPVGGTVALAADAKDGTTDAKGPHGGVIQVVGGDKLEIVAEDGSEDVRVYVLDAEGKPTAPGDRKITLALIADTPEVVVLSPSDDGLYVMGKLHLKDDPSRITVVVRRASVAHVAIVGWKPGTRLIVSGGPPAKVKIHVKANGTALDIKVKDGPGAPAMVKVQDHGDHGGGHGKGKGKEK